MGSLRLMLALIVVGAHLQLGSQSWGVGVGLAVKAFFIVSGFYMGLVLTDRYRGRTGAFYVNRLLRLLPIHLVVLAAMFALALAAYPRSYAPHLQVAVWGALVNNELWIHMVALIAANVLLMGSDLALLTCLDASTGALSWAAFNSACPAPGIPLYLFLVNPPMWTLGIEILFYAVAPFCARLSTPRLVALTVVAFLPRLWLLAAGLDMVPWNRSVAPFELVYFLLGMLAHRAYVRWVVPGAVDRGALGLGAGVALALTALAWHDWGWAYLLVVVAALPGLFLVTGGNRFDRLLGDLSYPVYAGQFLVLGLLHAHARWVWDDGHTWAWVALNVAAVLALAVVLEAAVARPVEALRRRIVAGDGVTRATVPATAAG